MNSQPKYAAVTSTSSPTPVGNYNPDFGYAIHQDGAAQAMYLVVETKGYEHLHDISSKERQKIKSAEKFFSALQAEGVPVRFRTKLNHEGLADLIAEINRAA